MSRSPLHVGIVAPSLRLLGGHAVQGDRLVRAWDGDAEFAVRLVPIDPPAPRGLAWTSGVRYLRTVVNQVCHWGALLRTLPRLDVVHVFCTSNASFFLSAMPAILVARMAGVPIVANYRGDATDHLRSSRLARWCLRLAAANVAPSEYFRAAFASVGITAVVVPNVCDLERFPFCERPRLRPRLLSTRNLEPIYDVACTLRAFAFVQRRHPDASLMVVGDGSDAARLRTLARDLGLRNVTFAGRVAPSEIARFYAAADVYVQTPVVDNMPGSLIEAFACGLPAVATSVGGVPCIMQHGTHGLLAPPGDHEAVAACVTSLVEDGDAARRMAAAARASCERYAAPMVREAWRVVYRALHPRAESSGLSRDRGSSARATRRPAASDVSTTNRSRGRTWAR